jgi:alpha-ketoglutarate-dependent taurine dioxygenase
MVYTLRVHPNSETFEKHPPTYTSLKLVKNPPAGGDTLFISSYGLYERLSEPWQKFAESLTGKRNIVLF